MRFPSWAEIKSYSDDQMDLDQWAVERDRYTLSQKLKNFPWEKTTILLVEGGNLTTPNKTNVNFNVLVMIVIC